MTDRLKKTALSGALALLCLAAAPAALAAPVTVNLRVEGVADTIFDGAVVTDAHQTTTPSDGVARPCDGTNSGGAPTPTAIGALDDGSKSAGFAWDAEWDSGFGDYYPFLQIGSEKIDSSSHYLAFYLNWVYAQFGGCTQSVKQGDEVLFAHSNFSQSNVLRLRGPSTATTGQSVTVHAEEFDGVSGKPAAGASVSGATTGSDGSATLSFPQKGIYRLKAERSDAVRSNSVVLCVDPPGAAPCTSTDSTAPSVESGFGAPDPDLPGRRLASRDGRSRTMLVSWAAQDGAGSGVAHYSVEVSEASDGAGASQAEPKWRTLLDKASVTGLHFRGESGDAYRFRITATDRALNSASIVTDPVLVPVDDRDRRLLRLSRGWKRSRAASAWGRTVVRASRPGATGRMRFRGTQVALIGRKLRRGGRLRVTIDGRSRTIRTRGRSGRRSVLWVSPRLRPGAHVLRLRSRGGGPVELDAVAPSP
jgi:hypothetical protein